MPELPDVEGFKRYFDRHALRQTVERTTVRDARILQRGTSTRRLAAAVKGRQFTATQRHGKHLFATAGEGVITMHFGMTGELAFREDGDAPKHAKVTFDFRTGGRLDFLCRRMLGRVGCAESVEAFIAEHGLGPDAVSDELSARRFAELFSDKRGAIKAALMDQSVVAGVGNVWADEVLFQTGIAPTATPHDLGEKRLRDLHRVMRRVLKTGSRRARGETERLPDGYLHDRRRADADCPKCGGKVKRQTVSGRTTYWCPACQDD